MKLKREDGITLLEVMISMVIMTVGLLGIAPLLVLSIESNSVSKDIIIASNIAREKIEYFEALETVPNPYTEYESDVTSIITNMDGTVLQSITQTGYNRSTLIQSNAVDTLIPPGLLKVVVAVNWTDKIGIARQTSITTFMLEN